MRYESHTFNPVVFLCVHPVVADKSIRKCITINQAWHIIFFVFAFCRVPSAVPLGAAQSQGSLRAVSRAGILYSILSLRSFQIVCSKDQAEKKAEGRKALSLMKLSYRTLA